MMSPCFIKHGKKLLDTGVIDEERLNRSVRRILDLKEKVGMLDNPYGAADEALAAELFLSDEHRAVCRDAAVRSAVLLKNDGVLPLSEDIGKVAVIGPHAKSGMIGFWSCRGRADEAVSVYDGISAVLGEDRLVYAKGANGEVREKSDAVMIKEAADAAYLLAAALRYFCAQELFVPQLFATKAWFAQVDTEFFSFLSGCDENGFNPMWFGGEEDYNDNDTNVEIYRRLRQKEKLSVVMCRLLHDAQMTGECRERYHSFLRSLLLDGEAEVLWQFLAGQYAENSGLISVLTESGCVSAQNREAVLQRLSGIGAEGKALLLTWYTGQTGNGDFFGEMEL